MNMALDYHVFAKAIELINAPQLNIMYSDIEGNIGLFITGDVPIRKKGDGQLPVDGSTGEYDWDGIIPIDQMPRLLNPERGYIVSCNNKIVNDKSHKQINTSSYNKYFNGFKRSRYNIFCYTS